MDLKAETIGLAVAMELPLVVVDIQRAGPSTGMPTKTEAADLLMALYGRHGESPLPVVAASTPADCFDAAIEAARIAVTPHAGDPADRHLPRELLGALAAARRRRAARDRPRLRHRAQPRRRASCPTCATSGWRRPWAVPGTPGLRHRIGGLEKEDVTGNISYQPENHEHMTRLRAERIARVEVPDSRWTTPTATPTLLVLGWGSSYGAIEGAARRLRREQGAEAGHRAPAPPQPAARATPASVLRAYERVLVPEMNMGQLSKLLRAEFLVDVESYTKVDGLPIFTRDVMEQVVERLA